MKYKVIRDFPLDPDLEVEATFDTLEEAVAYRKEAQEKEKKLPWELKASFVIEEVGVVSKSDFKTLLNLIKATFPAPTAQQVSKAINDQSDNESVTSYLPSTKQFITTHPDGESFILVNLASSGIFICDNLDPSLVFYISWFYESLKPRKDLVR